ncbi:MAG: hypothetical protein RUMPE_01019 [Eubacteriales bacterium SKADARSKE-1]|nr:hypothetical protein [Eubacteriales bacterium SKADARSKE-1]
MKKVLSSILIGVMLCSSINSTFIFAEEHRSKGPMVSTEEVLKNPQEINLDKTVSEGEREHVVADTEKAITKLKENIANLKVTSFWERNKGRVLKVAGGVLAAATIGAAAYFGYKYANQTNAVNPLDFSTPTDTETLQEPKKLDLNLDVKEAPVEVATNIDPKTDLPNCSTQSEGQISSLPSSGDSLEEQKSYPLALFTTESLFEARNASNDAKSSATQATACTENGTLVVAENPVGLANKIRLSWVIGGVGLAGVITLPFSPLLTLVIVGTADIIGCVRLGAYVYADNAKVRQWYNDCESKIQESIYKNATVCEQARQAFDERNDCRVQARSKMKTRPLAWFLDWWEPNWTWEGLLEKQSKKYNVSGEAACENIIESAQRSRASVNNFFGVSH